MRLFAAVLVLALSVPAFAQTASPKQPVKRPVPVQRVDFGQGDVLEGTVQGPDVDVVVSPNRPVFEHYKLVRDNFNDKLMASVDEM